MSSDIKSHKDLIVWQKAVSLSLITYKLTKGFPQSEMYALSSQMRRAAVSIASNIAEGRSRRTRKDFQHFLHMAYGSAAELETQLLIARQLSFCNESQFQENNSLLSEVSKMLRAMIQKLEPTS
ncbi:MAG: four helix bundle protein [Patescibacteria group bacterium]